MEELKIPLIDQVFYCDDALLKIRRGNFDKEPYELLITDLSFDNDGRESILNNGEEFIQATKKEFPELKTIVFSIENRTNKIKKLFNEYDIDGFVTKGRNDMEELKKTIMEVYEGRNNIPSNSENVIDISEQDEQIIKLIGKMTIKEISDYFKRNKITPNSESFLNKRIMEIRHLFGAKNNYHLLIILSDSGWI